jgi:hypothetical protein
MHDTSRFRTLASAALLVVSAIACSGAPAGDATTARGRAAVVDSVRADSIARARQDSINRTLPGYVVDSILPVEETVRRFQARVGGTPVTALMSPSPSRDALVARFVKAVAANDTTDLLAMVVNAREFIDLVYPESPSVKPPYQQPPDLVWRMIQNPSVSGFKRLVRRAGGIPMRLVRYQCDAKPGVEGKNRFWTGCVLTIQDGKKPAEQHRLFGNIIERDGQFKLVSFKNEY